MSTLSLLRGKSICSGRWHSTTSWMLSLYAVIFSMSVFLLLGFIGWSVTTDMQTKTDIVIAWQFHYFDALPDAALPHAIETALDHEHKRTLYAHGPYASQASQVNYYGLFAADGRYLAGNIVAFPSGLAPNGSGVTLDRTLTVALGERPPIARAMARRRKDGSTLVVARGVEPIRQFQKKVVESLLAGGLLCLLAGVAGGYTLGLRLRRRIKEIRRVTERISRGDLGQRLAIGGRDELSMLAQLVNHMLDEVERLMDEVKIACDGIAHDLRTPLAHVHSVLARAAERSHTLHDDALTALISQASVETTDLLGRFQAMLRISEIGALQRSGGFASVQLETIVAQVHELYGPLAESRSIRLAVEHDAIDHIHGDRELLFEMLVNLVDNAVKFTPDGGSVNVTLKRTRFGPRIDVVDSGIGIAPQEREAVLRRFYRSNSARHIAGSGLGLGIVSAVARLHQFAIRIEDAAPGTRVVVEAWSHALA